MGRALQHSLISNLFSLFRLYKFPVRTLAANRQKCPRVRDIVTKITAAQVPFSRISLYFSLLAGILGGDRVAMDGSSASQCGLRGLFPPSEEIAAHFRP